MNAVPCDATAVLKPEMCRRMVSICPSQHITSRCGERTMFDAALSKPKRTRPFLKMGVSGEFTYFPERLSSTSWRPEKATTRPCLSRTVNMSRPAKRW